MCCCSKPKNGVKTHVSVTTAERTMQLAIDPVCGMMVDPENEASPEYRGIKVRFCCRDCAAKFRAEPVKSFEATRQVLPCKC